jgi:hypothetical protein
MTGMLERACDGEKLDFAELAVDLAADLEAADLAAVVR